MLEGVVLKSSFLDDEKPIRQKVHFFKLNGINGPWPIPDEPPSYEASL